MIVVSHAVEVPCPKGRRKLWRSILALKKTPPSSGWLAGRRVALMWAVHMRRRGLPRVLLSVGACNAMKLPATFTPLLFGMPLRWPAGRDALSLQRSETTAWESATVLATGARHHSIKCANLAYRMGKFGPGRLRYHRVYASRGRCCWRAVTPRTAAAAMACSGHMRRYRSASRYRVSPRWLVNASLGESRASRQVVCPQIARTPTLGHLSPGDPHARRHRRFS